VVELAVAITIMATIGDVKSTIIKRNPGYTEVQWHAEVAGNFEPLVVATCIAVGFWLWMAWSIGRGHRWARVAFALFFGLNTYSLLNGLAGGSAVYARPDLAIASLLWLVELAATVLIFRIKNAGSRSGARRIASGG
jgi:hypothetical protein